MSQNKAKQYNVVIVDYDTRFDSKMRNASIVLERPWNPLIVAGFRVIKHRDRSDLVGKRVRFMEVIDD